MVINTRKKDKNLYDYLREIPDFRRKQWTRHELSTVLLIIIMWIMSWYNGIRAIWDFIDKHKEELIDIFRIEKERLPTFVTVWTIIRWIKFEEFEKKFQEWMLWELKKETKDINTEEKEIYAIDWKVICGTVSNPNNKLQKYINLVSIFNVKRKQVINVWKVWGEKKSEIPVVRQLIRDLWLEWVIFTIDALHCQKETVKAIIESKNDYIIWVKWNQKKLQNNVKKIVN